ncbi:MAG: PilT/PilU family type 4a pilus ATPase [Pseudomonadales bacterium]|nr:PilT/PilU family type 4a pilus ATPase [Pseudomonadales bacterium]
MEIDRLLKIMVEKNASDLFITTGVPPSIKINGKVVPVTTTKLSPEKCRETVLSVMTDAQRKDFVRDKELNFAISARGVGRFRVSAFYQRNLVGMVLRRIETQIPDIDDLGLPKVIKDVAMTKRGLIVFVGGTGTGKSTSLAAMIGHRNRNSRGHIITIEDPIEFMHSHQGCIVTQREVGIDTDSFEVALKNTLRQAPDVILIGEVRTQQTMEHAITFAETGHLCLCTLHANNANQALDRILNFFPPERHDQLWLDLSLNLKAMIAQQLIRTPDGQGRVAAIEVMLNTPLVSDLIKKGDVTAIKPLMAKSNEVGMQTFDQALFRLYKANKITYDDALNSADSANDLRLMIKLDSEHDFMEDADRGGLSLQQDDDEKRGSGLSFR